MRLRVKNFQSIKEVDLEVSPGQFACLVGKSDIGKSSVVRALSGLMQNSPSTADVRLGESSLEVILDLDSGSSVCWKKGKGVNEYGVRLEGSSSYLEIKKGGREVPDEVRSLGLSSIQDDDVNESLLVREQLDLPFLLSNPRGIASLVSRLGSLHTITRARTLAEKDVRSTKSDLRSGEKHLADRESVLSCYSPLVDLRSKVEWVREKKKEIDEASDKFYTLGSVLDLRQSCLKLLLGLGEGLDRLTSFLATSKPSFNNLSKTYQSVCSSVEYADNLLSISRLLVASTECLEGDSFDLSGLISSLESCLVRYSAIDEVEGYVGSVLDFESSLSGFETSWEGIFPSVVGDLDVLEGRFSSISSAEEISSDLSGAKLRLESYSREQSEIGCQEDSLQKELSEFKACPLCGGEVK